MTLTQLLLRSLVHYRRKHLWVVMGTMVSTAILVGAFVIGDSVQYSLRQIVFDRLGSTEYALSSGSRFFRTRLADDLTETLRTDVAPALQTNGIAIVDGGSRRVNRIQVWGVDARFGSLADSEEVYDAISPDEAVVNRYLADRLGVREGDEILLRLERLDALPKDAPLALDTETSLARRVRIRTVASDAAFGRFNLRADQIAPLNVFVSLSFLSQEMGLADRANVLLVAERDGQALDDFTVNEALKQHWELEDAGLEVRDVVGQYGTELRSNRIFMDFTLVETALQVFPGAELVTTYFVNAIGLGNRTTPYSFVSAPGSPQIQSGLGEQEIIINEWLSEDIAARAGDEIELTYYVVGHGRDLKEQSARFRVKAVVPIRGVYADRDLLPDFPGLAGEDNCRDWSPGIPIDLGAIRDKDEDYWDEYGGTPKAFVSLQAAERMWRNRFGYVTAVRFPGMGKDVVEPRLLESFSPADLGFVFQAVKAEGLQASSGTVSFSQLFLGLSFFIIVAALLLTGLLFVMNTEDRTAENGLLLALGFSEKAVRRRILVEGAVLIVFGSILGGVAGVMYHQFILLALKTVWQPAVGHSNLRIHITGTTLFSGILIGSLVAFLAIWVAMRKQLGQSIVALKRGWSRLESLDERRPTKSLLFGLVCMIAVCLLLLLETMGTGPQTFDVYFASGTLLLAGGMALTNVFLFYVGQRVNPARLSLLNIGIRNNARRRLRSVTLIGLLACGMFIVFTVGSNRLNALKDADRRDSGTGGFTFFGESSLPILYDLNRPEGIQFYGLERLQSRDVSFVQFRVKEGDDASCLNLNRITNPQLLGFDPRKLAEKRAFTFAEFTAEVDPENPWSVLENQVGDGLVPAVADLSVIVWGMGKSVGDTLTYLDEEGQPFRIKLVGGLANSIFQGNLLISEEAFIGKYPSISGYRTILADVSRENREVVADELTWAMQDLGLDLIATSDRLAAFNAVQNTYLSIFLILGSFGLLLGSFGLGIVVWRSIKERQGELALLRAVGFSRHAVQAVVLFEHLALLTAGIFCGLIAALLATLPSWLAPGAEIPYLTVGILFVGVGLNGFLWTYLATKQATQTDLSPALRKE